MKTKGVQIVAESVAEGPTAQKGSTVTFSARWFLRRGDEVTPDHQSIARCGERLPTREVEGATLIEHLITLGKRRAIAGVEQALIGLAPGSFREVMIPPHLGYGARGLGDTIPPNALLRVKIWVHDVANED